jgi:hypothetical protein
MEEYLYTNHRYGNLHGRRGRLFQSVFVTAVVSSRLIVHIAIQFRHVPHVTEVLMFIQASSHFF